MTTTPETTTTRPVRFGQKMGYGLGAIAYALPYQVLASFLLFFVTAILQVPPILAGAVIAVSVFWDAITDPWIGSISDRTVSARFGRRHQYLLLGGVGTALGSLWLWSIQPVGGAIGTVLLVLAAVLFTKTMNTFYGAPYYALGGSMSSDYDVRSSLQGYRAAFHVVGMILAIVGIQILLFPSTAEFPRGQLNPAAYPKIGIAVAVITLIIAIIAYFMIPKDFGDSTEGKAPRLWTQIKGALKNKSFRAILIVIFLIETTFQITIAIGTHVNTFTYHLNGPQMGILGLALLGMSVLSQPLWVFLSKRFEKRTVLVMGMVVGLIGFVGMPWTHVWFGWLPLDAPSSLWTLAAFSMLAGIGNGAFMSIPFSMVADSADSGQLATDRRQEGLYFGLYTFSYKLGIAFSVFLGGVLLDVIGFNGALTEQTAATSFQLAMVPSWLLVAISPFIVWAALRYRIDRATQSDVLAQIRAKKS
ncbi:MAG: MFS transporter [Cryobacterium sp.]|nr:MFS transporter [Micrococcales bacterium]MBX3078603.1 MFS transporter [Cryobacterium sp.]MBX3310368.1 MFS transporter [Cryobacterium sp.]MCB1280086.1 MFS transporter [Salinibacterium sp.]